MTLGGFPIYKGNCAIIYPKVNLRELAIGMEAGQSEVQEIRREFLKSQSRLVWTAADHELLGSTPPDILVENPGKNLGELLSNDEILARLDDYKKSLDAVVAGEVDPGAPESVYFPDCLLNFKRDLDFLRKAHRLPSGYDHDFTLNPYIDKLSEINQQSGS